jgi:very-short-patch-repair endonuclease
MNRCDKEELRSCLISNGAYLPYNPDLIPHAKQLRQSMTEVEKKLWNGYLRHHQLRIYRQRPIDHFIVDLYCPKKMLVIEIDGGRHFSIEGKGRDAVRTAIFERYGLRVQRFTNSEVINKFEWVCQTVKALLSMR